MVASIICFMADKLDANHASFNCRISEFYCKTGRCISADKVCNGADDCGDKSDELPYCTRKALFRLDRFPIPNHDVFLCLILNTTPRRLKG
ncbi:hypothetical protein V9T40_005187 [Parthenolecanium corni]|uniref:Uncharacterized protein n=1 Tax=Parthenolecanium corni TaxID=536013 RepID=A0AAN9Y2M2_9HEMI